MLLKVIKEYEIEERVGYFIADNTTSNNATIKIALEQLYPTISKTKVTARRFRYIRHIINLAA